MQAKREKKITLGYGEQVRLRKLFHMDDGSELSARTLWNILHYRTNSDVALRVRDYVINTMKVKPRYTIDDTRGNETDC